MAGLRIENLSKTFSTKQGRVAALDRVNLEVADGELLAVLGPSGCGKTTLLRIIAGLEQPDSGEVALGSKSLLGLTARERNIGFAFQYPALLPQLSVRENISLGPKLRGVSSAERTRRTERLATLLGVSDLLARAPETLSGGQQQRVSLARALANEPSLLLLDEPLANLDPTSRADLRDAIRGLQHELKTTLIYVTHDQSEAAAVADRIALLHSGTVQQVGAAPELFADPANLFVAEFFAPERANVLQGAISDGHFRVHETAFSIPTALRASGEIRCLIHPTAIRSGTSFRGVIHDLVRIGWSTTATVSTNGAHLRATLAPDTNLNHGNEFNFSINPAGLFFFNAEGLRLR